VKDDISQIERGVTMEPSDGAKFVDLSEYNVMDIAHTTYSCVEMGMSKDKNVSVFFSKDSKRGYQQINNTMWDKAKTLAAWIGEV
jgi:hypothetical protein